MKVLTRPGPLSVVLRGSQDTAESVDWNAGHPNWNPNLIPLRFSATSDTSTKYSSRAGSTLPGKTRVLRQRVRQHLWISRRAIPIRVHPRRTKGMTIKPRTYRGAIHACQTFFSTRAVPSRCRESDVWRRPPSHPQGSEAVRKAMLWRKPLRIRKQPVGVLPALLTVVL